MKEIYLDNSATTRVCDEAAAAAVKMMTEKYGNPSSLHSKGLEAEHEIVFAKKTIAAALGADADEIYFCSGGTEANNLAVLGAAEARKRMGKKIVTTATEHSSVYECMRELEKQGFETVYLKTDEKGHISEEEIFNSIDSETILVSMMLVNNELGAVLPVGTAARAIRLKKAPALLHSDCVQAFCKMPFKVSALGADLISISAHKIHAPKGIGALYAAKNIRILPRSFGGEQQKRLRPGTEAAPLIAAFGEAVRVYNTDGKLHEHICALNKYCITRLKEIPDISLNSPDDALPYIINLSVKGIKSEVMIHYLEARGIYISGGSACSKGKKSHVLSSVGLSRERIDSALRVSFSKYNTKEDIDALIEALESGIKNLAKTGRR